MDRIGFSIYVLSLEKKTSKFLLKKVFIKTFYSVHFLSFENLCFKCSLWKNFRLTKKLQNNTKNFHILCTQLPHMVMFCVTTVHLSKLMLMKHYSVSLLFPLKFFTWFRSQSRITHFNGLLSISFFFPLIHVLNK